ncbi:hypothetical protein DASC09_036570 [Saccharomycopsis crataegensis]|uniref:Peptidase M3A/M3B catalytic domain-containing protein n=1 Tax=Saccharomycopsis crataegensis TaxID=43959 RepID=A0AAV5QP18_9ASCO|nr:hypothetical protein DASC09_036570 [Saccharomycopsis crataegensis]
MTISKLTPPQLPPTWNDTPENILELADKFIADAKALDDKLAKVENPTIDNLIRPYYTFSNENKLQVLRLGFYRQVSENPDIRKASIEASKKISEFGIESGLREDLFVQFKKVYMETKDDKSLDPELSRYIYKVYNRYKRRGLELPLEQRSKVESISKELSQLSIDYRNNLNEQTEFLLFDKKELKGVPENIVSQFADVEGKLKVTYKYPDIIPVIKYAKDPQTRRTAMLGNQNKVGQNAAILKQAIVKRAELANVLGYKSYSEYVLEERMTKTPENVLLFENDLLKKLKPKGQSEVEALMKLKLKDYDELGLDTTSKEANTFFMWDLSYYHNILLEEEYKVDEQKISEFFPLESTIKKMLGFYEVLFQLKFIEETNPERKRTWHKDVKQFALWKTDNPEEPEFLGWIYFDLHPRDGKYGHAAHFIIKGGYYDEINGVKERPVSALVCNFSKPQNDKPSLLKHSEVKTFFHELGHGIHSLACEVKFSMFHGTAVARDFVECPSQMLEFWVWSAPELKKLSSHYETGEPLDDSLIESMVRSKHVNGGLFLLRQVHFGLFDMTLHNSSDGVVDVDHAWNRLREEISLTSIDHENTVGYASFGHMMGGYASAYYGYLYSKVFATDIYYTIFKKDPFNTENGVRYRDIILKRGGSIDEIDILKELLGREPNSDAFLIEHGVNSGKL